MIQIRGSKNLNLEKPVIVAMGNFDGVHLAHQKIISIAVSEAKNQGLESLVYTFDPHPAKILSPDGCPPLLQTIEQRIASIKNLGADICVVEEFDLNFARLKPEDFLNDIIVNRLKAKGIVIGYDFTFGEHRHGTSQWLLKAAGTSGIKIEIVEAQFLGDTLLSSTNIRQLIRQGHVADAALLLDRAYEIEGEVVKGRGIGASLGAHTANIKPANELIPADGVYFTTTRLNEPGFARSKIKNFQSKDDFRSVTSIGTNPTFHKAPFSIETHLIDADVNAIGMIATIKFLDKMRDQVSFASSQELKNQIKKDIDNAKACFKNLESLGRCDEKIYHKP